MSHKRFIGILTGSIVLALGPSAHAQWTGEWNQDQDCNWSTPENWAQLGGIGECDTLLIFDTTPCQTAIVDSGLPPGDGYFPPHDLHVGHGMTIHVELVVGLWVRGMMFITGTVIFEGEAGVELQTLGLRLGQIGSLSPTVLTNETCCEAPYGGSPLRAGVSDDNHCIGS